MNRVEEWTFVMEQLQEKALNEYRASHAYELREKRQEDLEDLLFNELAPDQKEFIEGILFELVSFYEYEADLLYQQGMKDCTWLLKRLGVLA